MAKILRKNAIIFGANAGTNERAQFGSLAAGGPAFSTDPDVIQALSNYIEGWFSAVLGGNSPAIEDMNALCFVMSYQIAYTLQTGVPEWNTTTPYYIGSMVTSGSQIYVSLTDANTGNAVTSAANWELYGRRFRTVSAATTLVANDHLLRVNPTAGNITQPVPLVAAVPVGTEFTIKNIATNGNTVTLTCASLFDGAANLILDSSPVQDSITLFNNGTSWDII